MLTPGKRKYGRLSERKVKYVIRHKIRDKSTRSIALERVFSISTVKRVWAYWLTYHECIHLKKRGRPEGEGLSVNEREIIKRAKGKYKLGTRRLENVIVSKGKNWM
ncbi:MAG: hypothetical protein C5S38_03515 [Candidatus Methanophagaceae archaeon]|nr:MAG: hypothetical protein C5S38_03515 [Methanophagales archaeon]KAF5430378.1 hypothetical protein C5S36_13230 [Methanophagales archaeon]